MPRPVSSVPGSKSGSDVIWIVIPTYNDWEALAHVLASLDEALRENDLLARVLVVDDGSTTTPDNLGLSPSAIARVDVARLRRNLGHQRAIAVGLAHLIDTQEGVGIVVMDGDGQDRPSDINRLLQSAGAALPEDAVFAARMRRSEGVPFTLFYHLYRLVHRILTGVSVRMGNFSFLPWAQADRLVVCSELWNHYAAAVVHARIPYRLVPCARGMRVSGRSKMNPVALVTHGLSAMAVFADRIGVRVLAASGAALAVAMLALAVVLALRLGTALALPGWATTAAGLLVVFIAQVLMLSTVFTFVVLAGRGQTSVVPLRDYRVFLREVRSL